MSRKSIVLLAFLAAITLRATLHRSSPSLPLQQKLDATAERFGVPPGSTELVERRTLTAKHFRLPDGRMRAVFSSTPLHWVDDNHQLRDLVPDFRRTPDGGHVADQLPFVARLTDGGTPECPSADGVGGCIGIGDHGAHASVVYALPERATVQGNVAAFHLDGLPCTYRTTASGLKLGCTVAARRGAHTYEFRYRPVGVADELTAQPDGSATNSIVTVSAPMVIGADQRFYAAGGWRVRGGADPRLAFDFDDSQLPAAAFPYVVDPTTTFDLGICCTSAAGISCQSPIVVCTANSACTTTP